jgi:hypothetical protein
VVRGEAHDVGAAREASGGWAPPPPPGTAAPPPPPLQISSIIMTALGVSGRAVDQGSARRRRPVAAQSGTRMPRRREGEAAAARGCGRFGVPSERAVKMGSGRPGGCGGWGAVGVPKIEDLG